MTVRLGWIGYHDLSLICKIVRLGWTEYHDLSLICMIVRLGWADYHAFLSYFRVFQMSAILRVFGLQL